jgi:hypothetical protein
MFVISPVDAPENTRSAVIDFKNIKIVCGRISRPCRPVVERD